ncbi:MAG: sulfide/dihydroorotate dehydrogenase-like FAD/NAD-binding protein [Candidatus Omnitrophota bacterium]|nr:sulfide/dihydroorotate dehydrogenase-like FAD/NAD-binding protein [Candidatus Omnitrophota bacterium]
MFTIVDKKKLNPQVTLMKLKAPHVIRNAKAGQFVMIKTDMKGERIPLTIVDTDKKEETISIIFQEVGTTTKCLAEFEKGDSVMDILGPLGKATHVEKAGKVICVGGGVGAAEIYPVAKAFREAGNEVTSIAGARSKDLLLLLDEMKAVSKQLYIATDDGSFGKKGFVTDILKELLDKEKYDLVYAVGPIFMMKAVALLTKKYNLKTIVSLNANMVDATGMCGTCRVTVEGKAKFACVDGPDFDAHEIDFEEFISRDRRFKDKEEESLKHHEKAGCRRKG